MSQWVYNNVFVWFQSGYVIVVSQWVCDCDVTVGIYNCLCVVSKWVCDCGVTVGIIYVFVWFKVGM